MFIRYLSLFKKIPAFIRQFILILIPYMFINYILNAYSINLLDPFYIKIISIFGIIVGFILALDNFVQLIIYSYFKKDADAIISTKLPKIIYNYLNDLKILTKLDISYNRFFLMHLGLYIFIIVILLLRKTLSFTIIV